MEATGHERPKRARRSASSRINPSKSLSPGMTSPMYYAGLGEKEQAFACLEKAFAQHDAGLTELKKEVPFDDLRSDPRFRELMRRVGLPP